MIHFKVRWSYNAPVRWESLELFLTQQNILFLILLIQYKQVWWPKSFLQWKKVWATSKISSRSSYPMLSAYFYYFKAMWQCYWWSNYKKNKFICICWSYPYHSLCLKEKKKEYDEVDKSCECHKRGESHQILNTKHNREEHKVQNNSIISSSFAFHNW